MDIHLIFLIEMQPLSKFIVYTKKFIYEKKFHFISLDIRCTGFKRTENREFIWKEKFQIYRNLGWKNHAFRTTE